MFKKMKKKALKRLGVLSPSDTQLEQEGVYKDGIAAIQSYFNEERPHSAAQLLSSYTTTLHRDDIVDAERLKIREQLHAEFDKLLDPRNDVQESWVIEEPPKPHEHVWFTVSISDTMVIQRCICQKGRLLSQAEFLQLKYRSINDERRDLGLQPVCHHRYRRKDGKLYANVVMFQCTRCDDEYEMERWKWEALLKGHIKL